MKKTIITIITAFIAFFLVVVMKNSFSYKIPNDTMGVQAVIRRGNLDYLFLGSSSFRKGINMKLLEEELSDSVFMLTYNGNQPMNAYVELEEILDKGTKINTIVYEIEPGMMDKGAELSDKRLLWDIDFESKMKIWRYLKERDDVSGFMFYDYWVSSNMDYLFTYLLSQKFVLERYYLGGNDGSDVLDSKTKEELDSLPINENPDIDGLQVESLAKIMDLCKKHGVELVFIEPPKYAAIYKDDNYSSKRAEIFKLFDEQGSMYYKAEDLDFDNTNPDFYYDLSHTSELGMQKLTGEIVYVLRGMQ